MSVLRASIDAAVTIYFRNERDTSISVEFTYTLNNERKFKIKQKQIFFGSVEGNFFQ